MFSHTQAIQPLLSELQQAWPVIISNYSAFQDVQLISQVTFRIVPFKIGIGVLYRYLHPVSFLHNGLLILRFMLYSIKMQLIHCRP